MNKLAEGELQGPVFMADVTDNKKLFGAATFDKGAWTLHMLRHVMGDQQFFEALRTYVLEYSYRQRDDRGFPCRVRALPRQESRLVLPGMDLRRLTPDLSRELDGGAGPGGAQDPPGSNGRPGLHDAHHVLIATAAGATRHTVWNDRSDQTFQLPLRGKAADVERVTLDPDNWILKHRIDASTDAELR